MKDILLVRQAIYDNNLEVIAYELLFKRRTDQTEEVSGHAMTAEVIINTFADVGLMNVIGDKRAYINFPKQLLTADFIQTLPKEKVVIEILENMEIDEELVATVTRLSKLGYWFALDDFVYAPEWEPLIAVAKIIKIDVLNQSYEAIRQQLVTIKHFKGELLAEKIEDHAMLDFCKYVGFKYFQGYFLSKPNPVKGQKVETNKALVMRLFTQLQNPQCNIDDIERLIAQDSKMSYKLLKIVNTVAFVASRKVNSIKEAIMYLGLNRLKSWVALLAYSIIDNKPNDLLQLTAVRAKMCALIAEKLGQSPNEAFFTAGLFSTIDALLDQDMEMILQGLPLDETLVDALLTRKGRVGEILKLVIAYEQADWDTIAAANIPTDVFFQAYVAAVEWAQTTQNALK